MVYLELKRKHTEQLNNFPMEFAFNKEQFQEGLDKLGVEKENICTIPGGGFIRKADAKALGDLLLRQTKEMDQAMLDDDFLINAIEYELGNHEYCITHDPEQTLNALGIDLENDDERVVGCFKTARKNYLAACEVEGW